jgi:hypothetical protein
MSACREAAPKADYINAVYTRGEDRARCKSFRLPSIHSQLPDCFRAPSPVLQMAFVGSLLLEDCSSVDS